MSSTDLHLLTLVNREDPNPNNLHLLTEVFKHAEVVILPPTTPVRSGQGASPVIITDTITIVRFVIDYIVPCKMRVSITKLLSEPFDVVFNLKNSNYRVIVNLLVHHLDITTKHLINTIRTAIAGTSIKTDENIS